MMVKNKICDSTPKTGAHKVWLYGQYYLGEKDAAGRKSGDGEHHWSGAESLEWYSGRFLCNTMHGYGEYRWRHRGREGISVTYEGNFYGSNLHGYGTMSYPDGQVFKGIFCNNVRWGPGIETEVTSHEDVGLWRGTKLIRLAWRPPVCVIPDFLSSPLGQGMVERFRVILSTSVKKIGEINSAVELLKDLECNPKSAFQKWKQLYPKLCNDLTSPMCETDVFDANYYKDRKKRTLEVLDNVPELTKENSSQESLKNNHETGYFYAWNNNTIFIHMMKHCYTHDYQRNKLIFDLINILSGPRGAFRPAGHHEIDCRTLLMASYLGNIITVSQLIKDTDIDPNVADLQGNTPLMYAAYGMHENVIHFLVEAGADVDSFNDACCTPLGMALLRFACIRRDISPSAVSQAIVLPSATLQTADSNILEWNIVRNFPTVTSNGPANLIKSTSKTGKIGKSPTPQPNRKNEATQVVTVELTADSDTILNEDTRVYHNISREFNIRVTQLLSVPNAVIPVPYLFELSDILKEIDLHKEESKKNISKSAKSRTNVFKPVKDTMKPSTTGFGVLEDKTDKITLDSEDKQKLEMLVYGIINVLSCLEKLTISTMFFSCDMMMNTILQLLSEGADVNLVQFPQPALFIAIVAQSSELVQHLIKHGANVNEVYGEICNNYTPLCIAVSREFTYETLEIIKVLLEGGANTNYRFSNGESSTKLASVDRPTLLHAMLFRKVNDENEAEVLREILELLLKFNCDPLARYEGRSALDVAFSKDLDLFEIFIKNPKTNLNGCINENGQNCLVKMFTIPFFRTIDSGERQQTLTTLLLFGADPLIECCNDDNKYQNIFVYTKHISDNLLNPRQAVDKKPDLPSKKEKKKSKTDVRPPKISTKIALDDALEYRMALELMTECARILHVRWLQAKLVKELVKNIYKYKHRDWTMILREHKNMKAIGLWLSAQRCFEIWDIMKTNNLTVYSDRKVLKYLLCTVHHCSTMTDKIENYGSYISFQEKTTVESDIHRLLKEWRTPSIDSDSFPWMRSYVKPELAATADEKFKVCFECSLPFTDTEQKIPCEWCGMVSFCSFECVRLNIGRVGCHPCSEYLKNKYYSEFSDGSKNLS